MDSAPCYICPFICHFFVGNSFLSSFVEDVTIFQEKLIEKTFKALFKHPPPLKKTHQRTEQHQGSKWVSTKKSESV